MALMIPNMPVNTEVAIHAVFLPNLSEMDPQV